METQIIIIIAMICLVSGTLTFTTEKDWWQVSFQKHTHGTGRLITTNKAHTLTHTHTHRQLWMTMMIMAFDGQDIEKMY